jgi:subtilisin family serine protease
VGAYDRATGGVARYSSRGPTADGRRAVDLVGPADPTVASVPDRFTGSSAATAYVGGVAALVRGADPGTPPRAVERRLRAAAVDVGANGTDAASGWGLVDAGAAVRATNATRTTSSGA